MTIGLLTHGWIGSGIITNKIVYPFKIQVRAVNYLNIKVSDMNKNYLNLSNINDKNINLKINENNINIRTNKENINISS